MDKDIRWIQRFENFNAALKQLLNGYELSKLRPLTELESQGYIQAFEFTHELAWNVIKDYFDYQGRPGIIGSRDAAREAFNNGLLVDGDAWMEMIKSLNLTSHTYNKEISDDIIHKISNLYVPEFLLFQKRFQALIP